MRRAAGAPFGPLTLSSADRSSATSRSASAAASSALPPLGRCRRRRLVVAGALAQRDLRIGRGHARQRLLVVEAHQQLAGEHVVVGLDQHVGDAPGDRRCDLDLARARLDPPERRPPPNAWRKSRCPMADEVGRPPRHEISARMPGIVAASAARTTTTRPAIFFCFESSMLVPISSRCFRARTVRWLLVGASLSPTIRPSSMRRIRSANGMMPRIVRDDEQRARRILGDLRQHRHDGMAVLAVERRRRLVGENDRGIVPRSRARSPRVAARRR